MAAQRVIFSSGGERFALDVDAVREVSPPQEAAPVPFVPAAVAGVVNHRGTLHTLVGFSRLAGLGDEPPGAFVVLRLPELAVALAVGAVEGIEPAGADAEPAAATAATASAGEPARAAGFLSAGRDANGRPLRVVDAPSLAEAVRSLGEPSRPPAAAAGGGA